MNELTLAALGVEQRQIAVALFTRTHLDEILVHHLPSDQEKATTALVAYLRRTIESYCVPLLALQKPPINSRDRQHAIYGNAIAVARLMGVPTWEVSAEELFAGFGYPSLDRKEQLRRVGRNIWPVLASKGIARSSIDAAVLGLHVQVERMLALCEAQA